MKLLRSRILWGSLFVVGGLALLLDNLKVLKVGGLVWGLVLAIAGLVFISLYLENRLSWWPLIPGFSLLAMALAAILQTILPAWNEAIGAVAVLGGIGLSFLLVYLVNHENWWAIIPAGVLATLAGVSAIEAARVTEDTGGYFFIGIGLTFLILTFLPTPHGQMKWSAVPALILLVLGLTNLVARQDIWRYAWPVLVILGGGILIYRALAVGKKD